MKFWEKMRRHAKFKHKSVGVDTTYKNASCNFSLAHPSDWRVEFENSHVAGSPWTETLRLVGPLGSVARPYVTVVTGLVQNDGKRLAAYMQKAENDLRSGFSNLRILSKREETLLGSPAARMTYSHQADTSSRYEMNVTIFFGKQEWNVLFQFICETDVRQSQNDAPVFERIVHSLRINSGGLRLVDVNLVGPPCGKCGRTESAPGNYPKPVFDPTDGSVMPICDLCWMEGVKKAERLIEESRSNTAPGFLCKACGHFFRVGDLGGRWLFACPDCRGSVEYVSEASSLKPEKGPSRGTPSGVKADWIVLKRTLDGFQIAHPRDWIAVATGQGLELQPKDSPGTYDSELKQNVASPGVNVTVADLQDVRSNYVKQFVKMRPEGYRRYRKIKKYRRKVLHSTHVAAYEFQYYAGEVKFTASSLIVQFWSRLFNVTASGRSEDFETFRNVIEQILSSFEIVT